MKYLVVAMLLFLTINCYSQQYKLLEKPKIIVACGYIKMAGEFLFLDTKDSTLIIGLIKCPDSDGKSFFVLNDLYSICFGKGNKFTPDWKMMNFIKRDKKRKVQVITGIKH